MSLRLSSIRFRAAIRPVTNRQLQTISSRRPHASSRLRNNLGLLCLNQGRLAEAEAHFNEVLRINPGDTLAQNNLRIVARAKAAGR